LRFCNLKAWSPPGLGLASVSLMYIIKLTVADLERLVLISRRAVDFALSRTNFDIISAGIGCRLMNIDCASFVV
jgi:hypothetical protein